jgi:hypothetical protein
MMDHASLRVEMLNMRTFRPHFGIEASGVFANLSEEQWARGVDRLCASQAVCMASPWNAIDSNTSTFSR